MVEAKNKEADWAHVDEATFTRFMEFLYTGDYTAEEPGYDPPSPPTPPPAGPEEPTFDFPTEEEPLPLEPEPVAVENDPWGSWGNGLSSRHKDKKAKKKIKTVMFDEVEEPVAPVVSREMLWESFTSKATVKQVQPWHPKINESPYEDYTPVFLGHAKLYTFSDERGITPLMELVIYKLRLTLSTFTLHSRRVKDVITLLRFVYENTSDRKQGIDQLRDLVSDYVVCRVKRISEDGEFMSLLQENGDMLKDVVTKLM